MARSHALSPRSSLAIKRIARGHYEVEFVRIAAAGEQLPPGEFTARYARMVEEQIRAAPADWPWSHKRWKLKKPLYGLNGDILRFPGNGDGAHQWRVERRVSLQVMSALSPGPLFRVMSPVRGPPTRAKTFSCSCAEGRRESKRRWDRLRANT